MIIFSAKLTRKRLVAISLVTAAVLVGTIFAVSVFKAGVLVPTYGEAGTEQQRLDFMRSFGWEVKPEPVSVNDVLIPRQFDAVYERYNEIQIEQGLDLSHLAGRVVTHYCYEVTNYPTGESGVLINLLVYKSRVVGGDVMSPALDGFMHGFTMP